MSNSRSALYYGKRANWRTRPGSGRRFLRSTGLGLEGWWVLKGHHDDSLANAVLEYRVRA